MDEVAEIGKSRGGRGAGQHRRTTLRYIFCTMVGRVNEGEGGFVASFRGSTARGAVYRIF